MQNGRRVELSRTPLHPFEMQTTLLVVLFLLPWSSDARSFEIEKRGDCNGDYAWNARCKVWKLEGKCEDEEIAQLCPLTCGLCGKETNEDETIAENDAEAAEREQTDDDEGDPQAADSNAAEEINLPQCGIQHPHGDRVIGGTDAVLGEYPWQAWLNIRDIGFTCGGSLIRPEWVLTAAHCILDKNPEKYRITLGDVDRDDREGSEQIFGVKKIIVNSQYDAERTTNDVALIQLSRAVKVNDFVNTVCLPSIEEGVPPGTHCFISGWGMMSVPGTSVTVLQNAPMPIVSSATCNAKLEEAGMAIALTGDMLCAGEGGKTNISGCFGDSGGPLVCKNAAGKFVQQGVVSWGNRNCEAWKTYSVFARVGAFRDWIEKNIGK